MTVVDAALSDGREHLSCSAAPHLIGNNSSQGSIAWSNYADSVSNPLGPVQQRIGHTFLALERENIPTAIVKPKYQKILHDDRQLLTNAGGYVNYCKSANHNNNNNNNLRNYNNLCASGHKRVNNNSSKLQAAFEETRRKAALGSSSSSSSSPSSSNAIVGVVTPRKKNYNEIRSGTSDKMNSELDRAREKKNQKSSPMDFNENNVISDKNCGRPANILTKRTSRRTRDSSGWCSFYFIFRGNPPKFKVKIG